MPPATIVRVVLTAEDLWPLVSKLSPEERMRLIRLALARGASSDAEIYRRTPPGTDEFSEHVEQDPLAWDAEGWDHVP